MGNWKHQAHEFQIGRAKRARALLWPMRSGKTKACVDKADYNIGRGEIEGVIVLAPNGVHLNWVLNEIPKWSKLDFKAFAWSTPRRADWDQIDGFRDMCLHTGPKWMTANKEALSHADCQKAIRQFIVACHGRFMLIVDESHHFARPGAKRTRLARGLSKKASYRMICTGTVIMNSPLRAFSQYEILHPHALGFDAYKPFAEHFAEWEDKKRPGGRTYKKVKVYRNMDELREKMAKWSSLVLREDIHDMPELLRVERPVEMSAIQRRAYLEMVSRHIVEIGSDMVSAKDAGARMMKLQQIVNGYVMREDGAGIMTIDNDAPIYDALIEEVGGTLPGKSIVWCRFREDVRRCVAKLRYAGYEPLIYDGGVPIEKREPIRLEFQNNPRCNPIVGTPGTGGEGLDFSAADAVIFWSATPNTVQTAQAEERGTMVGGKSVSIVRVRTLGTVDDRLWQVIDDNMSLADSVSGHGLRDFLLQTRV